MRHHVLVTVALCCARTGCCTEKNAPNVRRRHEKKDAWDDGNVARPRTLWGVVDDDEGNDDNDDEDVSGDDFSRGSPPVDGEQGKEEDVTGEGDDASPSTATTGENTNSNTGFGDYDSWGDTDNTDDPDSAGTDGDSANDPSSYSSSTSTSWSSLFGDDELQEESPLDSSSSSSSPDPWDDYVKDKKQYKKKDKTAHHHFLKFLWAVQVPLLPVLVAALLLCCFVMTCTANQLENNPEGTFANACRLLLSTVGCTVRVVVSTYHGRVPPIVCAADDDDDDDDNDGHSLPKTGEYSAQDLERMQLRAGIEKALEIEHVRAMDRVSSDLNKMRVGGGIGGGRGADKHPGTGRKLKGMRGFGGGQPIPTDAAMT